VSIALRGVNAVASGVELVSGGGVRALPLLLGNVYNQAWGTVLDTIIAACGMISGLGVVIVRVGGVGVCG
jgi:hypothetical protein